MIVYKQERSFSIGKWLLAAAIFILAMTVTWDEVEGSPPEGINSPTQISHLIVK